MANNYGESAEAQPALGTSALSLKKGDEVPPTLKRWWRGDRDKAEDWYDIAKEDFDFPAGRQYSEEELKILRAKKRPDIVFNRTDSVIDAVAGYEVGNRREVRYIPRELGDATANEMLTSAGQWFNDKAGGDYVRSDLFKDLIVCGMGWSETRIDYTESAEGEPREDHIDPFEMTWDRDARQRNLGDATRVWRARRVPLGDAMEMFPGYNKAQLDAAWSSISSEADLKRDRGSKDGSANSTDYVTIIQCQYLTRQPYYLAQDPMTGEQSEFTEKEFNDANKRLKKLAGFEMEGVKFRKKVIKQAFLGGVVLSYGDAPCPDEFSLQCVTGKYDRNKGFWYGIIRAMKDPQRWANKWLSQMMFIMNSNSKGGLIAEKRAFADIRNAEATWSQPDSITTINDGAMGAIKEKTMAPFPVGFQQLTEFAVTSIREVSGVSLELMGTREANQANVLEQSRKQAGLNILQWAFDGMKLYSERQGSVVLYYLQNDLSDGRLIRILGKDNEQYVPLIKQADLEYDIIVDDSPTSPNQKEQIWGIISGFLPLVGKVIPPEFILQALEYSPLPGSVVSKLKDMANAPNPEKQQAAAMAAKAQAAEIDKTTSQAMLNKANAQKAMTPDGTPPDPNIAAALQWRETLFNGLIKLEVAKIGAKSQNDSDQLDAQIEGLLHLSGLASDHLQQMRQMAHERAMAQIQHTQALQQQQNQVAGQSQLQAEQAQQQPQPSAA
jgi:hypothetical protein